MISTLLFSYRAFQIITMAATAIVGVAAASSMAIAQDSYGSEQEVPFSLNPPVVPGTEPPVSPDVPYPPVVDAVPAEPAAAKDWSEMDLSALQSEKARLKGELEKEDANYSPAEKKKMRNLLKRIESEIARKSLEPSVPEASAKQGEASAEEGAGKDVSKDGEAKTEAATEKAKAKVKTPKEKIRETIHNRRYRVQPEEPDAESTKK